MATRPKPPTAPAATPDAAPAVVPATEDAELIPVAAMDPEAPALPVQSGPAALPVPAAPAAPELHLTPNPTVGATPPPTTPNMERMMKNAENSWLSARATWKR